MTNAAQFRRLAQILAVPGLMAPSLAGCASVGFIGMDPAVQARFTPICSSTNGSPSVVYNDTYNPGDVMLVQVQDQRRASVEASTQSGAVRFSGYFDGGSNGSPGNGGILVDASSARGVHLGGVQVTGATAVPPTAGQMMEAVRQAADKGLTDINFNRILPGRPCEVSYGYNWRSTLLHPNGY